MLHKYKPNIISLSKTWLKEGHYQFNYVNIPGYTSIFKNRQNKKCGGVGFYVDENISVKIRHDFTKTHPSLEILFIEAQGGNKNTPYLIAAIYQPSSKESEN